VNIISYISQLDIALSPDSHIGCRIGMNWGFFTGTTNRPFKQSFGTNVLVVIVEKNWSVDSLQTTDVKWHEKHTWPLVRRTSNYTRVNFNI